ncbi:glutathione S-transferase [Phascolomyces articulosus]|uniref:Glutathione S-transferase n=1 Tax=Phascolomyces articulosus TaxID=60185 RepID=A0AAD5PAQ0_9FUNG|nr:glutathione S-transferase [Phascolomyces articulosus]
MTNETPILYRAFGCPYVQRAEIAFKEIELEHEKVEIDLENKPEWYKDINPSTKVPALKINGRFIAESLVLMELANDLKPEKGLLPSDPVKRAEVRLAIEVYSSKVIPIFGKLFLSIKAVETRQANIDAIEEAYSAFNDMLLKQAPSGPYFLGSEYSLADIAIAPIHSRVKLLFRAFFDGLELQALKKYPRLEEFSEGITSRPSFKETFMDEDTFVTAVKVKLGL